MSWTVTLHGAFAPEFDALEEAVQDELLAMLNLLKAVGPQLVPRTRTRWQAPGT